MPFCHKKGLSGASGKGVQKDLKRDRDKARINKKEGEKCKSNRPILSAESKEGGDFKDWRAVKRV